LARRGTGIGADASLDAAGGSDATAETVTVDRADEGHALSGGGFSEFAEPADVSAMLQRPRRQTQGLSARYQPIQEAMGLHLAKPAAAVHDQDRRRLLDHGEGCTGLEPTVADGFQILRDADQPV
jgi:hypothetical protein